MKISILGTGMVGRTIAAKLASLGHQVVMGTRSVEQTMNRETGDNYGNPPFSTWYKDNPNIELADFATAAVKSDGIIFNCTSGKISIEALNLCGQDQLNGKILLDLANPLDFSNGMPPSLNPVNTDSLGEQIQRNFPQLRVVKTLNTLNAGLMVDPSKLSGPHNLFVSGNDTDAKNQTIKLLSSFGWPKENIIDLGDITTARGTEMLLPIWLRLWSAIGNANFNFYIRRN